MQHGLSAPGDAQEGLDPPGDAQAVPAKAAPTQARRAGRPEKAVMLIEQRCEADSMLGKVGAAMGRGVYRITAEQDQSKEEHVQEEGKREEEEEDDETTTTSTRRRKRKRG